MSPFDGPPVTTQAIESTLQLRYADGKPLSHAERLARFVKLATTSAHQDMVAALPLLLNLKGQPYTLDNYFPFENLFRYLMPNQLLLKTGRQVSKSTSIAAHGIMTSVGIPNFTTLYVMPLYEQVRRLSGMFVGPFVEQSPVRQLWQNTNTVNSVLHRSFTNDSKMLFSFAFLSADRLRGVSADKVCLDESVRQGTLVETPEGRVAIENLSQGDSVYAVDEFGQIQEDTVIQCSYHGIRDCYRLTLSDGQTLDATRESFIATTDGWRTVETIVADFANSCTEAVVTRNAAGRRVARLSEQSDSQSSIRQCPQSQATRVQRRQIPGIIRVCDASTQNREEQRLRRVAQSLDHTTYSGIVADRVLVFPPRQEARNAKMARSTDLARRRLVVSGRRESAQRCNDVPYRGIHVFGGKAVGFLADAARYRRANAAKIQVLADLCHNRRRIYVGSQNSQIHPSDDELQNCATEATNDRDMSLVQTALPTDSAHARPVCPDKATLLRTSRMRESAQTRERQTLPRNRGTETTSACLLPCPSRRSIGKTADSQTASTCAAPRSDLHTMPQTVSAGVCSAIQEMSKVPCAVANVVSIKWVGQHPVYDIETANHRTFFANGIAVHNCQDLQQAHLPIIHETLSASKWSIQQFTGTPKTLDNTIQKLWEESSQSEWFVPCFHCTTNGYPTWNIPSIDHHAEKMIGPWHRDISEKEPATICHKCGKRISPRFGRWIPRRRDRVRSFPGYHVPQIVMPLHYADHEKWSILLQKQQGKGNTPPNVFWNEVIGDSYDTSAKIVTLTELNAVSNLGPGDAATARSKIGGYAARVLAIDWGGGGSKGLSFTVVALLGLKHNGCIDVLWGKRLLTPHDHLLEAVEIKQYWDYFRPHLLAHDYTGSGSLRETFLIQAGVPIHRVFPCAYVRSSRQAPCYHVGQTELHPREHYRVDKARTLQLTCGMIKIGALRFFDSDYVNPEDPGLIRDFLALIEDKVSTMAAGEVYRIDCQAGMADDFAQAVNIGCVCLWYRNNAWPNLADMIEVIDSPAQRAMLEPITPEQERALHVEAPTYR